MSLSDKRIKWDSVEITESHFHYPEEDVKEAVKELKEELGELRKFQIFINTKIDKIFGEKLI